MRHGRLSASQEARLSYMKGTKRWHEPCDAKAQQGENKDEG